MCSCVKPFAQPDFCVGDPPPQGASWLSPSLPSALCSDITSAGQSSLIWSRKRQPTPVFLPGKSHGQMNLVGYSPRGHKESDMTEYKHALLWSVQKAVSLTLYAPLSTLVLRSTSQYHKHSHELNTCLLHLFLTKGRGLRLFYPHSLESACSTTWLGINLSSPFFYR